MSRLNKFFLSLLLFLGGTTLFAQSFYELKFKDVAGNEYTGFWVYKSELDTYMRMAYFNEKGEYRVVNVQYKAETGKTDDGVYYYYVEGSNPTWITDYNKGETYAPDHFMWVRYENEEYGLPFVTDDPELSVESFREVDSYEELDPSDFDKEYLNQFYSTDEADYLALMNMVDDNNSTTHGDISYSYSGQGDTWATGGGDSGGQHGDAGNLNHAEGNPGGIYGDTWTGGTGGSNSGSHGDSGGKHGDTWTGNSGGGDSGGTHNTTGTGNTGNNKPDTGNNNNSGGGGTVTLHLIVVANTDIGDIGTSCEVDKRNLINEFEGICEVMNMQLNQYVVEGKNFTKAYLKSTLNRVKPGSNDVVLFVYTGHGFRWSDQAEKFPQLDMRYNPYTSITSETSINLQEVYNTITGKGARLNIVLGDCCNSDVGVNQRTSNTFLASRNDANFNRKNLTKLFFESKGNILATAASPGQVSWSNAVNGGFFLSSFFQAFREEIGYMDTNPNWDEMLTNTIKYAAYKSSKAACSNCTEQNGQKSVSISY